jgi:hypothetical protein
MLFLTVVSNKQEISLSLSLPAETCYESLVHLSHSVIEWKSIETTNKIQSHLLFLSAIPLMSSCFTFFLCHCKTKPLFISMNLTHSSSFSLFSYWKKLFDCDMWRFSLNRESNCFIPKTTRDIRSTSDSLSFLSFSSCLSFVLFSR